MEARRGADGMKIFILALGTRGDVALFLGLARALRCRGHEVAVGTSVFHEALVRTADVGWARIGSGTRDQMLDLLRSMAPITDLRRRTRTLLDRWFRPQLTSGAAQLAAAGRTADYFVSNLGLSLRRGAAGVPGAIVTYDPPERPGDVAAAVAAAGPAALKLVALNRALVDPDDAWGRGHHFTGHWRHPPQPQWQPSAALAAFIAAGPPPVTIAMGSMATFDAAAFQAVVTRALGLLGRRGLLVDGWGTGDGAVGNGPLPIVGDVPYDWLLPRSACVVHHGGAGTVDAVLRSGTPSIVLPQLLAQSSFARILGGHGLIAGTLAAHDLTADGLARAIERADDDALRTRLRRWSRLLLAERGAACAAELIEAHAAAAADPRPQAPRP